MTTVVEPRKATRSTKGPRELFAEVGAEQLTKSKLRKVLKTALASEIIVDGECTECGCPKIRVAVPDVKKQMDVICEWLEQAEGRPEQRAPGALMVTIVRPPLG